MKEILTRLGFSFFAAITVLAVLALVYSIFDLTLLVIDKNGITGIACVVVFYTSWIYFYIKVFTEG